ncbi:MAG TPA: hypothetical protein DEO84_08980 [candidate division Zixibacteria bacterium]|nr:hypothetical protein [candidate division Zixibacteria bacterium]
MIDTFKIKDGSRFGNRALIIGIIGLALSLLGFFIDRNHFFFAYLTAFTFWLTVALGGLFFVMLHHLVNATWSIVLRRIAENIMSMIPFLAIFVIPILFGIGNLYHWSHADILAENPVLRGKAVYLNTPFFIIRTVLYFAVWIFLTRALYKLSIAQDKEHDENRTIRLRRISAPGMVAFAFTFTFASFDWLMSLNAAWYSTAFGVYIYSGSVLSCLAFLTLTVIYLQRRGYLKDIITPEHYHDLGKLLFTFVVFWAYIAFAQYFLIWYGNIPEETQLYHARWGGWWNVASLLIVFGHFVFPFIILITRSAKRSLPMMTFMGFWLLLMHWVDLYWVIRPGHAEHALQSVWIDLATMVGIGGLFLWYFWRRLSSEPLIPVTDPRLKASIGLQSD